MTNVSNAVDAATPAIERLAAHLIDQATRRCRSEELERCNDFDAVFDLVDDMAREIYRESFDQRVCRILTKAGIDLPISDAHGFNEGTIVLEAVMAACDELAMTRLYSMPASLEEALQLAAARVRYERQLLQELLAPYGDDAAAIDHRLDWLLYRPDELAMLVRMGILVMRNGQAALSRSEEERSGAQRALQDWLVSDVQARLGSYYDPRSGPIGVCDVALTAEEVAAVRAAATQLHSTAP